MAELSNSFYDNLDQEASTLSCPDNLALTGNECERPDIQSRSISWWEAGTRQISQIYPLWHLEKMRYKSEFATESGISPKLRRLCRNFLLALMPTFVKGPFIDERGPEKFRILSQTSYLDGLRGTAAFLVATHHFCLHYFPDTMYGYGEGGHHGVQFWHHLPFVRLYVAGAAQVAVFFVLSGFVISHKPLKLMRSGAHSEVFSVLVSSTFRRWMRLFIPVIFAYLLNIIYIRLGFFTLDVPPDFIPGYRYPQNIPSWNILFKSLWINISQMSAPWNTEPTLYAFDPDMWTIPTEFRMSIIVFASLLGLAKSKPIVRMSCFLGGFLYAMANGRWQLALFTSGVFWSDFTLAYPNTKHNSHLIDLWWCLLLVAGLFFASHPRENGSKTPGYMYMWREIIPSGFYVYNPDRFPNVVAAELILVSLIMSKRLRWGFETSLAQYLGKLSFALYLMHGPLIHSVCDYFILNISYLFGMRMGYVLGGGLFFALLICISDVVTYQVDVRAVEFAKWMERKCAVSE